MIQSLTMAKCRSCNARRLWRLRIGAYTVLICPPCDLRERVR